MEDNFQMTCIYILKLEQNKYYIGRSDKPKERIQSHIDGEGSEWTKTYKPIATKIEDIEVVDILLKPCENSVIIKNCSKYDENKFVIMYMNEYRINNVRGGMYSQMELTDIDRHYIERSIRNANDKCFICNGGHFAKKCQKRLQEPVFLEQ